MGSEPVFVGGVPLAPCAEGAHQRGQNLSTKANLIILNVNKFIILYDNP